QGGGIGDVVAADVIDLEGAGAAAAQQHVAGVVAEEATKGSKRPVRSDLAEGVARENGVVADVVNFVMTHRGGGRVRAAQDQIGGGGGSRRRVRRDRQEVGVVEARLVGE